MSVADILKKYDATPEKVAASGVAAILEKYNATPENIAASFEKPKQAKTYTYTPGGKVEEENYSVRGHSKFGDTLVKSRSELAGEGVPFRVGQEAQGKEGVQAAIEGLQIRKEEATAERNKAKEALSFAVDSGYDADRLRPYEQAVKDASDKVGAIDSRMTDLATGYYYRKNRDQVEKLAGDIESRKIYQGVTTIREDMAKLSEIMSGFDGSTKAQQDRAYLAGKYGLTERELEGRAAELYRQLEAQSAQEKEKLKTMGYDYDAMEEYQQRLRDKERYERRKAGSEKMADENPVGASVATVGLAPARGVDFINTTLQGIGRSDRTDLDHYVPLNYYRMDATNRVSETRGKVAKNLEEDVSKAFSNETLGQIASFAYQTGMSIADSFVGAVTMGKGTILQMGAGAAAEAAKDVMERGGSNRQVMLVGLAAGIAEAFFEKFSIENLLTPHNVTSVKRWVIETLKQAGTEASEEIATEIANIITDTAIMNDRSEFSLKVKEYTQEGMSRAEAEQKAYLDQLKQVAMAGLGGLISGGVMGGVSNAWQGKVIHDYQKGVDAKLGSEYSGAGEETVRGLIDQGMKSAQGTEANRLAQKLGQKYHAGQTLTDAEIGALVRANDAAIRAEEESQTFGKVDNEEGKRTQKTAPEGTVIAGDAVQDAGSPAASWSDTEEHPLGKDATRATEDIIPEGEQKGKSDLDFLLQNQGKDYISAFGQEAYVKAINEAWERGEVRMNARGEYYRMDPTTHIDQRDMANVGARKVEAFQYQHPELHQYFTEAAKGLLDDLDHTVKGERWVAHQEDPVTGRLDFAGVTGVKRHTTAEIARLLDDEKFTYDEIRKAIQAIIQDAGQENYAAAKRVELVLDDMMTNGYTDIEGYHVLPNGEYIKAKKTIPGAVEERSGEIDWKAEGGLPDDALDKLEKGAGQVEEERPHLDRAGSQTAEQAGTGTAQGYEGRQVSLSDGDTGRRGGERAWERTDRVPSEVRQSGGTKQNRRLIEQRQQAVLDEEITSPASEGVPYGSEEMTCKVLSEYAWDEEIRQGVEWAYSKGVKNVKVLLGTIGISRDGLTSEALGIIDKRTGTLYIRADSLQQSFSETLEHEVGHRLTTRETVQRFMAAIQGNYKESAWGPLYDTYMRKYAAITDAYAGMTDEEIELYVWEEILEDAYADVNRYGTRASVYGSEADSVIEGRQSAQEAREEPDGQHLTLGAAWATEDTRGPPDVRASIETLPDGKKYVKADRQVIFGNDPESWSEQLEDYINGKIRRGQDVQLIAEDGEVLILTATTAGKVADNHTSYGTTIPDEQYERKVSAGAHIDELVQISKKNVGKNAKRDVDGRHGEFAEKGWDYRRAFFRDFDGKYYRISISVARGRNGNVVYNIGQMQERSFPTIDGSSASGGAQSGKASLEEGKTPSKDIISAKEQKSNPQILDEDTGPRASLGETVRYDSEGRQLTSEQQERFKNSKVLDDEGNLLVVYHGTDADFSAFDMTKGRSTMDIQGAFFSPWEIDARGYGGKVRAYYLNITNPAPAGVGYRALNMFKGQNDAGVKARKYLESLGYDGVNNDNEEYIAFYPEQIKLVENKTPTDSPDVRYSTGGGELGENGLPEGYDSIDDFMKESRERAAQRRAERVQTQSKESFRGTAAMEKLGVKIEGSVGVYQFVDSLKAADASAKAIQRSLKRAEQRLQATEAERNFAAGVAAGVYEMDDIPRSMDADKVMELADYYMAEKSATGDRLAAQKEEIKDRLGEQMEDLFRDADKGYTQRGRTILDLAKGERHFDSETPRLLSLNYNTPERNMRMTFGDALGGRVNSTVFDPVHINEAERIRFVNRMLDDVRKIQDKTGKKSELTKEESALVQMKLEDKLVGEFLQGVEMRSAIEEAAREINSGKSAKKATEKLSKQQAKWARQYAKLLRAEEALRTGKADAVKIDNAAKEYREKFNLFYDAVNDFLVAHGYAPIEFRKNYAPHMQSEEVQGALSRAFQRMGVNGDVTRLPSEIAGLTASYKPNKRWNPYFLQRTGDLASYDILSGFESYVEYMSDVLYHMDDIMRVRAMSDYFRRTYAKGEIGERIEQVKALQDYGDLNRMANFLRDQGMMDRTTVPTPQEIRDRMEEYVAKQYEAIGKTTKYSDLVMWLDNYANILAGKQSMIDRGLESFANRETLNLGNKLNKAFARANVAGNLSSAINQTAQIPMIEAELGAKWTAAAIRDIVTGETTRGGWIGESDFLVGKMGVDSLNATMGEKVLTTMFKPAEIADLFVAQVAVRGKYLQEINAGKSHVEAMRAADRFGRDVMGDRTKGSKPVAFQSKNFLVQCANMFQIEALNSWEHIAKDLPRDFRIVEKQHGKDKAAAMLAAVLVKMLVGAFLLNRVAEEVYGGSPAPFDVFGLTANFVASGEGLTTNEYLKTVVDNGWEKLTGERLFQSDPDKMKGEDFDWDAAWKDTAYNLSNDIPFVRNVSGIAGVGDQTMPMPNLGKTVPELTEAVKKHGVLSPETGKAALNLTAEVLPGGKQMKKTGLAIEYLIRGGDFSGYGDKEKLKYPADRDPFSVMQALMFGKYATKSSDTYFASGDSALTVNETRMWNAMVEGGVDAREAYEAIKEFRRKTDGLSSDYDESGKETVRKKDKVMDVIDAMEVDDEWKDALYYAAGYKESTIDEAPWHKRETVKDNRTPKASTPNQDNPLGEEIMRQLLENWGRK